jgi:aminopeptidase
MSDAEFQRNLEKYAEVILKIGMNVQPGQRVWIKAWVENVDFVRLLTEQAYKAGASFVDVLWEDEQDRLIRFKNAPKDSFGLYSKFRSDAIREAGERGDAMLSMTPEDPTLLINEDPDLVAVFQKAQYEMNDPWSYHVRKRLINWTLIRPPTKGWAAKVFPEVPAEERIDRFWDLIFDLCRVKTDDPVQVWTDHMDDLDARTNFLNDHKFTELKLTAPGTDLTLGLPDLQLWRCARWDSIAGIPSVVNIPTEEIFCMPHRERVNGTVKSTKPLNVRGIMFIDKFEVTFKDGKVVDAKAEVGDEHLQNLLANDEGARYLGEIALVPHSSPISQSGRLLYNTLYDENASNHIALGSAYRFSIKDGENMSSEEFRANGGNSSLIHVDFMIGSGEMDVDGITPDGKTVPVMRSGEWAFEA